MRTTLQVLQSQLLHKRRFEEVDVMEEKPIFFNTEMVQVILDGRKTQTRRIVKPKYCDSVFELYEGVLWETEPEISPVNLGNGIMKHKVRQFVECRPRYLLGDILYVRETWQYLESASGAGYAYKAGGGVHNDAGEWRPSIHMPKNAARIFLKVTNVRCERLQDITGRDAIKEGIKSNCKGCDYEIGYLYCDDCPYSDIIDFSYLWNSTIKKSDLDKYSWNANPWVWVYDFERIDAA